MKNTGRYRLWLLCLEEFRPLIPKPVDAALSYQFSGSKLPEEYSYGGEDGLEETPIIRPSTEDPMLRWNACPGVITF